MYQESVPYSPKEDRYAGVRALWLKVIIRAIFDWVTYRDCAKLEKKKIADQAHHWLFEPNQVFNSFESICRLLEIPPDFIREKALSMTRAQVAKIEHLEREGVCPGIELTKGLLPQSDKDD